VSVILLKIWWGSFVEYIVKLHQARYMTPNKRT
jgi:hypothetical protein